MRKIILKVLVIQKIVLPLHCWNEPTTDRAGFPELTVFFVMDANISNINVKEYRLMYLFGAWVTKEVIIAETDNEAIFDADEAFANSNLANWKYGVALFCGNRKVKQYI